MNRLGVLTLQFDVRIALGCCHLNMRGETAPCKVERTTRAGEYQITTNLGEEIFFYHDQMEPLGQTGILFTISDALESGASITLIVPALPTGDEDDDS